MDQQREETTQQQSRRLKERLGEQFEIRDRALRQEFGRVHEKIDDLIKDNEARDKGIKREFRNVYEKMDSGFSRVDERFRRVDERMDKMSQKLDKLDTLETSFAIFEATFANFKVAHLNQRIQVIPVYDSFHQPVPVPKCFPKTALRLYRLQDRKNCTSLSHFIRVLIC
jgi:predicted  nucleic acid-binding Zn-ribbon protein